MLLRERDKKIFPLHNIPSIIQFFKLQLERNDEPNLTLLSIVIGAIENSVTCGNSSVQATIKAASAAAAGHGHGNHAGGAGGGQATKGGSVNDGGRTVSEAFPTLDWRIVESLYNKFQTQIKNSVNLSNFATSGYATREVVKKVSDVIWGSLSRSCYKDRAHVQSLFSYLTGNKLDCFGVAFAVVAACQILGFKDVHLALSEDHAWVVFGENSEETAEVTWHGKGNEDKRGQSITLGVVEKSWLYLNGHPVKCTRHMEVAAMVSSINPSVNATIDSIEIANLQQGLMWLLYDMEYLDRYPMALANLGDLEELAPSPGRLSCEALFYKSIESAKSYYNNQHVYPYTYLGRYFYRHQQYKKALEAWANAAGVIQKFNYNREDEEIYKEFLEIANELIPNVIKLSCLSHDVRSSTNKLLKDPECFGYLLRFYDSICKWEEGSCTPVLHIGWAKPLVNTISKFDAKVRSQVIITLESENDSLGDGNNNHTDVERKDGAGGGSEKQMDEKSQNDINVIYCDTVKINDAEEKAKVICQFGKLDEPKIHANGKSATSISASLNVDLDDECLRHNSKDGANNSDFDDDQHSSSSSNRCTPDFIKCLENEINPDEEPHPNIAALAAACSENILNPEYLLGSGEPFSSSLSNTSSTSSSILDTKIIQDYCDLLNSQVIDSTFPAFENTKSEAENNSAKLEENKEISDHNDGINVNDRHDELIEFVTTPKIMLQSEKMKGLKDLLLAEKLNVSAIQLQLTAQSQVLVVKRSKSSSTDFDFINIRCSSITRANKRSRRE